MSDIKSTKLTIREDRPTAIATATFGANVDAVGFNIELLALRNPRLAVALLRLFAEARKVQQNDPKAPEEDYALFSQELRKIMADISDDE